MKNEDHLSYISKCKALYREVLDISKTCVHSRNHGPEMLLSFTSVLSKCVDLYFVENEE